LEEREPLEREPLEREPLESRQRAVRERERESCLSGAAVREPFEEREREP
jgi:hypothetical protein